MATLTDAQRKKLQDESFIQLEKDRAAALAAQTTMATTTTTQTGTKPINIGGQFFMPGSQGALDAQRRLNAASLAAQTGKQTAGTRSELEAAGITDISGERIQALTPGTTEFIKEQELQAQKAKSQLEQRIALAREAEQSQLKQARTSLESQSAAVAAGTAQGLGGTQFGARAALAPAFRIAVEQKMADLSRTAQAAEQRRVQAQQALDAARERGLVGAAKTAERVLLQAQADADQARANIQQAKIEAGKQASDIANTRFDTITSLSPASLAAMSIDEISSAFTDAGLPASAGIAFQSLNAKLNEELQKASPDPAVIQNLQAQLGNVAAEKTSALDSKIASFQNLLDTGIISQDQFDQAVQGEIGIGVKPETPLEREKRLGLEAKRRAKEFEDTDVVPTGKIITKKFAGRDVSLDEAAMQGFQVASDAFKREFGEEIKIAAVAVSSTAPQADRIKFVVDGWNDKHPEDPVIFDPANPNQAAFAMQSRNVAIDAVGPNNKHSKGLAVDLFNAEVAKRAKPFLENAGWKQINPLNDSGHFDFVGKAKGKTEVEKQADAIITSTSLTTSGLSTKDNFRGKVEQALSKKQQEFRNQGDVRNVLRASAGGKTPDSTFKTSLQKGKTVLSQLENLAIALAGGEDLKSAAKRKDSDGNKILDLNPLTGWVRSKNPWDKNAQEINAIIQGTVPNLARGVFGEVGVLTDRDIELYRKTLPNLQQTDQVQKVVAGLTMRVVRQSLIDSLLTQADNGTNVAGNVRFLGELDNKIKNIEASLGIVDTQPEINLDTLFQQAEQETPQEFNSFFDNL